MKHLDQPMPAARQDVLLGQAQGRGDQAPGDSHHDKASGQAGSRTQERQCPEAEHEDDAEELVHRGELVEVAGPDQDAEDDQHGATNPNCHLRHGCRFHRHLQSLIVEVIELYNYFKYHVAMRDRSKGALAAGAWRAIFDLIVTTAPERDAFIRRLGLSPAESRALASLEPAHGRPMWALARD